MGAGAVISQLFVEIIVWRRAESGKATRYTCLQRLDTLQYGVQSSEAFDSMDAHGESDVRLATFLDLFIDVSPIDRCEWFDTIESAVNAHDVLFN